MCGIGFLKKGKLYLHAVQCTYPNPEEGIKTSNVIWHWIKGNTNIYTRRIDIVDKAMQEGEFVVTLENKPHIFVNSHPIV